MLDIALEEDNQYAGHDGQGFDAVGIAQSFTAVGKVAGHVAVDGHEREERRQAVVSRIGGNVEDDHHQDLDDVVDQGTAEDIFDEEGQQGVTLGRQEVKVDDEVAEAAEHRCRIQAMMAVVSMAFFCCGALNIVTPLAMASTPVMELQPLAKARRTMRIKLPDSKEPLFQRQRYGP